MKPDNRCFVEIDVTKIISNIKLYRSINKNKRIIAVVKANAYGHGINLIQYIEPYVDYLGVATPEEGALIRQISKLPIIILGYIATADFPLLDLYNLTPTIYSLYQGKVLSEYFSNKKSTVRVHLKINTGMNRLGIRYDDLTSLQKLFRLPYLNYIGIFSHFASAGENETFTSLQSQRFIYALDACSSIGFRFDLIHVSNSAHGLMESSIGNAVRIGYGMYGYGNDKLAPVLSWYARVICVRNITCGDSVGYGCTYTANNPCKIAVISVGYGDGYPRNLSNKGFVLYRGKFLPIIGRICMDMTVIRADGTDIKEDDTVCLIGKNGNNFISAEDLGFGYEILCGISNRVHRIYRVDKKNE